MADYELEFVQSVPELLQDVDHDYRTISNYYHISEMSNVSGGNDVRYGGEPPWTHVWTGEISSPDKIDALELSENASTRERIEFEVDRLMTMIVSSGATPSQTNPNDFEWTVFVEESGDLNQTTKERTVEVVWRPASSD